MQTASKVLIAATWKRRKEKKKVSMRLARIHLTRRSVCPRFPSSAKMPVVKESGISAEETMQIP